MESELSESQPSPNMCSHTHTCMDTHTVVIADKVFKQLIKQCGTREIVQLVKGQLCKHENLSSDPQKPCKTSDVMVYTHNPNAKGRGETRISLKLLASQLSLIGELWVQCKTLSEKKWEVLTNTYTHTA